MHNYDGESFFYKWEALRFNRGPIQFSSEDLDDMRKSIRDEIAKSKARNDVNKMFTRGNLFGLQSRNFAATALRGSSKPNISGSAVVTPMKPKPSPMVRPQDGFDMSRVEDKQTPVAGPSRVTYIGPATDEDGRKRRACEWDESRTNVVLINVTDHYMFEKVSERSESMPRPVLLRVPD